MLQESNSAATTGAKNVFITSLIVSKLLYNEYISNNMHVSIIINTHGNSLHYYKKL